MHGYAGFEIPGRRIEQREAVDRDFLSQFSFNIDPGAGNFCQWSWDLHDILSMKQPM